MTDRLENMLAYQRRLQVEAYGHPSNPNQEERVGSIKDNVLACTDELHEALNETGWKPWTSSTHINREAFVREVVDAWHFFMNMMNAVDMTAEELYQGYLDKSAINLRRQQEGYDGISSKCRGCKRDYNEPGVKCFGATQTSSAYCAENKELF